MYEEEKSIYKRQIEKEINRLIALKTAWEKVTYQTKLNGGIYHGINMHKNFNHAIYKKIDKYIYKEQTCLTVVISPFLYRDTSYLYDSIYTYFPLSSYYGDKNKLKQNNIILNRFNEPIYSYDLEDIKSAITDKINYYNNRIEELKKELSFIE